VHTLEVRGGKHVKGDTWDTGCKEGGAVTVVEKAVVESVVPGFLSGVVGASL